MLSFRGIVVLRGSGTSSALLQLCKLTSAPLSTSAPVQDKSGSKDLVLYSTRNHVTTMTMNNPKKLNGWTAGMMSGLREAMTRAGSDPETKVAVLTGNMRHFFWFGGILGSASRAEFPVSLSNHVGFTPRLLYSSTHHSPESLTHLETG